MRPRKLKNNCALAGVDDLRHSRGVVSNPIGKATVMDGFQAKKAKMRAASVCNG